MDAEERKKGKQLVKSAEFFNSFSDGELDALLDFTEVIKYEKNEFIVKEKTKGDSFFILLRGRAHILKSDFRDVKQKIASLMGGDCFGEMAILLDEPRSASIIAVEDCFVIQVELKHIERLPLEIREKLFRQFSISLARRLKTSSTSSPQG